MPGAVVGREPDPRLGVSDRRRGRPPAPARPGRLQRRPGAARLVRAGPRHRLAQHLGGRARDRRRPPGGAARRVRRTAERHLRRVSAAQAPGAARAAVDRLPQAHLRRPGVLVRVAGRLKRRVQPPASVTHFLTKLVRAAPASFLSSACLSHAALAGAAVPPPASFSHLVTKLLRAAPASFFSSACLSQAAAPPPASASHFFMKLAWAAPASFFSLACASHAALAAKAEADRLARARVRRSEERRVGKE